MAVLGDVSGNSFAIGDCADIKDYSLPCTAQVSDSASIHICHTVT